MDIENLKVTLSKLHAELKSTEKVDPELEELLQALDLDINHLLSKTKYEQSEVAGLANRSQAVSAKFAVGHPHIEPILRELGAILERMGI